MVGGAELGWVRGGTLGTGAGVFMERVVRLLSSLWCEGTPIGVSTLGPWCRCSDGAAGASMLSGWAVILA